MVNIQAASKLAEQIEADREASGHTLRWLSEESGIAYSTLKRKLEVTPEHLKVGELFAIAAALETSIDSLFVRVP